MSTTGEPGSQKKVPIPRSSQWPPKSSLIHHHDHLLHLFSLHGLRIFKNHSKPKPCSNQKTETMKICFVLFSILMFCYLFLSVVSIEDDIKCLEGIKNSLKDPDGKLSWSFTNTTVTSICNLTGVSCWNTNESRIYSLELASMQLSGQLPKSLNLCHSLQVLDLSTNSLSGSIPPELCTWLPYIVTFDLSGNSLSGPIPNQIVSCKFLNKLTLSDNKLSGSIPYELGRMDRLKEFSVARNDLSGPIPSDLTKFPVDSFGGNRGLCGNPLGECGGLSGKNIVIIILAGVSGALASVILGLLIWRYC